MAQVSRIQTLIIDGEPLACEKIRQMVRDNPAIALAGEYANLGEAASAMTACRPDLLFLDAQSAGGRDLEALEAWGCERLPLIVFTVAFDRYAVRTLEARALDFLLKPFDRERFDLTLRRASAHLSPAESGLEHRRRLQAALRDLRLRPARPDTFERMLNPFRALRSAPPKWARA